MFTPFIQSREAAEYKAAWLLLFRYLFHSGPFEGRSLTTRIWFGALEPWFQ